MTKEHLLDRLIDRICERLFFDRKLPIIPYYPVGFILLMSSALGLYMYYRNEKKSYEKSFQKLSVKHPKIIKKIKNKFCFSSPFVSFLEIEKMQKSDWYFKVYSLNRKLSEEDENMLYDKAFFEIFPDAQIFPKKSSRAEVIQEVTLLKYYFHLNVVVRFLSVICFLIVLIIFI